MTTRFLPALILTPALLLAPLAAFAMPKVGDLVGTNPKDAGAALLQAGCTVDAFEAEGGKIEAKCSDVDGKRWEVYIDPASGKVTGMKDRD